MLNPARRWAREGASRLAGLQHADLRGLSACMVALADPAIGEPTSARRLLDVVHRRLRDDDRRPVPLALAARALRAARWLGQDRAESGARAEGLAAARTRIRRALDGPLVLSVAPAAPAEDTAPAHEARLTPASLAEVLRACRDDARSHEQGERANELCRRWFALARQTLTSRPGLDLAATHGPLWLTAGQQLGDAAMVDFALILAEWVGRHQRLVAPGTTEWGGIARAARAPDGASAGRAVALVVGLRAARLNGDREAERRLRRMSLAALGFVDGWWRSTGQGATASELAGLLTLAGATAHTSTAELLALEVES